MLVAYNVALWIELVKDFDSLTCLSRCEGLDCILKWLKNACFRRYYVIALFTQLVIDRPLREYQWPSIRLVIVLIQSSQVVNGTNQVI